MPGANSLLAYAIDFFKGLETPIYAWTGIALLAGLLFRILTQYKDPYRDIPAIGGTGLLSSYLSATRFFKDAKGMLQEGYDKYKPRTFRFSELSHWHLVVTEEKLAEEFRKVPDDVFSLMEATKEGLATDYTLGPNIAIDTYHIGIVQGQLTRNVGTLFPDIQDEIVRAFKDYIPTTTEWTKVIALSTMMKIVARSSNRIFVGVPKCRDSEFIAFNIKFTMDVAIGAQVINFFPAFLKPLAGHLFTNVPRSIRTGLKHLKPMIEERQRKIDEYGFDYPDKTLTWFMDEAKGQERSTRNLTLRILALNFAAIHTTSMSLTHALFHLASRPEYVDPIRDEVESIIATEGWSKLAMTRMRKLDGFLKESARLNSLFAVAMTRKAMKDFTFSDGTQVPKGGYLSIAGGMHGTATTSNMREEEGQDIKNQMVAISPDYLSFGYGRHACPGRFFAANELKAMMAHIILTYDIKMEDEGVRPVDEWYGSACVPNSKAEVMFRKRQT